MFRILEIVYEAGFGDGPVLMDLSFNPSTQQADLLLVRGQPGLLTSSRPARVTW